MPSRILETVAIRRPLISGVKVRDEIDSTIAKFANAQLYKNPQRAAKLGKELVKLYQAKYTGYAQAIGKASAQPILNALGGKRLLDKGNTLRGRVLNSSRRFSRANLLSLRAAISKEVGALSGEIETAFMKAHRDGIARKGLIEKLVAADKEELQRLRDVSQEISTAGERLAGAEKKLAKASIRGRKRAEREVKQAQKELSKSKAKVGAAKTFLARFETKVQADFRDTIRREAEDAQYRHFQQAGYKTFTWIAVNGSDACPSCSERHGRTSNQWRGERPGEADTFCGSACMCALVPNEYTKGNPGVDKPLFRGDAN